MNTALLEKPRANSEIVLREEFDDWALLFNPDTGDAFGVNPTSVFIWKQLDGNNTIPDILAKLKEHCDDVSTDVETHVHDFVKGLREKNLVS